MDMKWRETYVVAVTPLVVVTVKVERVEVELVVMVLPLESVVVIMTTVTLPADEGRSALMFDSRAAI